jgi:DNA-binding winged helix-turn-helix (wHTH) protein
MIRYNSNRKTLDHTEASFVRTDSSATASRSMHLRTPSSRIGQHRGFVQRTRIPTTLQTGTAAEVLANIDGLPVLFRIFVEDAPAEIQRDLDSDDSDLHSLLSSTLGKMVDQMRGLSLRSDLSAKSQLAADELISNGEHPAGLATSSTETVLRVGTLELDLLDRTAKRGDRQIDLRPREYLLLKYMMQRSDTLLTRAMLFKDVWHYRFVPETNLVDVHMGRLRRKVDGSDETPMIRNVRGAGFVLSATPFSEESSTSPAEQAGDPAAEDTSPRSTERTLQ